MPYKPSKNSGQKNPSPSGKDLAPGRDSLRNEHIPKSAARVLNAERIRDEYRKKRKLDGQDGTETNDTGKKIKRERSKKTSLVIQPGESLQHFNRRVEDDLRPLVKSAIQTGRSIERNLLRKEREAREARKKVNSNLEQKTVQRFIPDNDGCSLSLSKEFATADTSRPKRLNDVVRAPPEFKTLPRGARSSVGRKEDVLSMSQKLLMEREREKVIARYRELKASRMPANDPDQGIDQEK